jgi:hypothetical protein
MSVPGGNGGSGTSATCGSLSDRIRPDATAAITGPFGSPTATAYVGTGQQKDASVLTSRRSPVRARDRRSRSVPSDAEWTEVWVVDAHDCKLRRCHRCWPRSCSTPTRASASRASYRKLGLGGRDARSGLADQLAALDGADAS